MNSQHRAIRAKLTAMSPKRAVAYIQSFGLPEEEERFLIECDVYRKSYIQAAEKYHASQAAIYRRRRKAYTKIADEIKRREESQG